MTVSAKYYVRSRDVESAQKAVDFWNNQSGQFAYETKDGQFKVLFDLKLEVTSDLEFQTSFEADHSPNANAYIVSTIADDNTAGGSSGREITVSPKHQFGNTGSHEVGHTLGMEHSESGIMTPGQDSPGRRPEVTPKNISQCISNAYRKFFYNANAKGSFSGGIVNRHGKVIKNK